MKSKAIYLTAWLCGVLAVTTGIIAAMMVDVPAGPVIVLSYVMSSIIIKKISSA